MFSVEKNLVLTLCWIQLAGSALAVSACTPAEIWELGEVPYCDQLLVSSKLSTSLSTCLVMC
jgi:hypothetical protein